jgi:hypothetical protein
MRSPTEAMEKLLKIEFNKKMSETKTNIEK